MTEKEYIEREAVLGKVIKDKCFVVQKEDLLNYEVILETIYKDLAEVINSIPASDVEPVRHGHWIWRSNYRDYDGDICSTYSCSNCSIVSSDNSLYCPNCGAKMDGKDKIYVRK